MRTVDTRWMDVEGIQPYPVFDVLQELGRQGRALHLPRRPAERLRGPPAPAQPVDRAPRHDDRGHRRAPASGRAVDRSVCDERDGVKKHLFRSRAKYFEPAGPVSWDVSMTATDDNWRVKLKRGDVVSHQRHLRDPQGLVVRVDGHHAVWRSPTSRRAARTRSRVTRSTRRARSPMVRCPRTTTTAAVAAACPTRASCPTGRASTRCRSSSSSISRATCRSPAARGCRRSWPPVRR